MAVTITVGKRSLGPLRVSGRNPRYFADGSGNLVYLAGAHTWSNLQDSGTTTPPPPFDYAGFLDFLQTNQLRLFRLWTWEQATRSTELEGDYFISPSPYLRTGPGLAIDGMPRFDLTRPNPEYFSRLRTRVVEARERGIYVIVMLFDGWSLGSKGSIGDPWSGHPFNSANNINGINGDRDDSGDGYETHTLGDARIIRLQEAYVDRVIAAVQDQPNVLYEISNESSTGSMPWQNSMVRFIRSHEKTHHPIGITAEYPGGENADLLRSSADWISPNGDLVDLAPGSGKKVVVADTDHLCGVCGDAGFPWRALTRGVNPLFMDVYDGAATGLGALDGNRDDPRWPVIRRRLGVTEALSERLDLAPLRPEGGLASTNYCLADAKHGNTYIVYAPSGEPFTVDVSATRGRLRLEWVDPDTGAITRRGLVNGGARRTFRPPFDGDAVLLLQAT